MLGSRTENSVSQYFRTVVRQPSSIERRAIDGKSFSPNPCSVSESGALYVLLTAYSCLGVKSYISYIPEPSKIRFFAQSEHKPQECRPALEAYDAEAAPSTSPYPLGNLLGNFAAWIGSAELNLLLILYSTVYVAHCA